MLTRRAHYRWWWRHSLWIFGTFTFDFLSWAVVLLHRRPGAARRLDRRRLPLSAAGDRHHRAASARSWLRVALGVQAVAAARSRCCTPSSPGPRYRAIMFGDVPRRGLTLPPQPPRLLQTVERPALPAGTDEVRRRDHRPGARRACRRCSTCRTRSASRPCATEVGAPVPHGRADPGRAAGASPGRWSWLAPFSPTTSRPRSAS